MRMKPNMAISPSIEYTDTIVALFQVFIVMHVNRLDLVETKRLQHESRLVRVAEEVGDEIHHKHAHGRSAVEETRELHAEQRRQSDRGEVSI